MDIRGKIFSHADLPAESNGATTRAGIDASPGEQRSEKRPRLAEWPLSHPCVSARAVLQAPLLGLMGLVAPGDVAGGEALAELPSPAIYAANHTSHLDTLAVLRALPPRHRSRLAVAAAADYFYTGRWLGAGVSLLLNAFPFSRSHGIRSSLENCAWLLEKGWSVLIFPEGSRSETGAMGRFRPGVGLLAVRTGVPVVPVYLRGLHEVLPKGQSLPRPGRSGVTFGAPLTFTSDTTHDDATEAIRRAVLTLSMEPQPHKLSRREASYGYIRY